MANTPNIRFKGFADDWEQRKLDEFGRATGGTSIESEFSDEGSYKVISIGSYSEDSVYRDQGIRAIESEKTLNRVLNKGDITMILNDKTASGNIIGRVLLIEESGVYVYNQRTERIELDNENYDSQFIYTMLNAPEIRDKIIKQSQGNTQIYVNWTTISQTEYMVPQIKEQQRIGDYFRNLDHLITLHQHKCDEVKQLKKFMLQKMFPQSGELIPEIRFAGFTDHWEQRKLGELMDVTSVKRIHQSDWTDSGIRFLRARDIVAESKNEDIGEMLYISKEKYEEYSAISGKVQSGDMLVTGVGTIGVPMLITSNSPVYFKDGNIIWFKNKNKIDGKFFYHSFNGNSIQKFIKESAGIGTVGTYTIESGKKTPINLPLKEEQIKIGEYFSNLDHLITLHQHKCDQLKEVKHFMLQNMFPQKG